MEDSLFHWRDAQAGAAIDSVGCGARIQTAGRRYEPDRVERVETVEDSRIRARCAFSEINLALMLNVEMSDDSVEISGTLENLSDAAIFIEQLWLAECNIDLGGDRETYRVYYNSGNQESSGTCAFSAIQQATGKRRSNLDPNDSDAKAIEGFVHPAASTCAQPGCIRSSYVTTICRKQPNMSSAVCVGDISFQRAEVVIYVKPGSKQSSLQVSPVVLYNGLQLDGHSSLAIEALGIYADRNPLDAMERYVDRVSERKQLALKPIDSIAVFWNSWMAFTEEENNSGAELQAMEYQRKHLLPYRISYCAPAVVWHKDNAFFESRCKPHLGESFAAHAARVAERYPELELCGGVFWGAASQCSDFFQQHPEAILRDGNGVPCMRGPKELGSWGRCPSPAYWVDFSHPTAKEFFRHHLSSLKEKVEIRTFNLDFMGDQGAWRGEWSYLREDDNPFLGSKPHDAHLCRPFETDRVIAQTLRESLGEPVVIRSYTALFMRMLGLVDVVRISLDTGRVEYGGKQISADWDYLRAIVQNLAANYMFHGKWWWSDADSMCVGTQPIEARTEEFRIRAILPFITGGPISLGDKIFEMTPEQFRYLTMNLPPTGHAARPLDLFDRELPQIFHLPRKRSGFGHDLLTLINLTDEPSVYELSLDDLELKGPILAFEFWTRQLMRIEDGVFKVTVPPRAARHFALHGDQGVPVVLGTDFHLSMGGIEAAEQRWDARSRILSGTIQRPDAESGKIFIWVPTSLRDPGSKSDSIRTASIKAGKVPVKWQITFRAQGS